MKVDVIDEDLKELIFEGRNSGKYKKLARNEKFVKNLAKIYKIMCSIENTIQLKDYSYLHYEKLRNNVGLSSIRVVNGMIERLLFQEKNNGIEIVLIELNSDHYGRI